MKLLKNTCGHEMYFHWACESIGYLYHNATKTMMYDGLRELIIDSNYWVPDEVKALGAIFHHYDVKYQYFDENGKEAEFPYFPYKIKE